MYNNIVEFKTAICDHTICAERFGKLWFMNFDNRKGGYLWSEDKNGKRIYSRNADLVELWELYVYHHRAGYNCNE